ncbi:MAG: chromate transporter [Xanthobacteraceae bacterium]
MKGGGDVLLTLGVQFAILSLLAIGGANAVVPEMHREIVDLRHWMSDQQFSELYAISQAAPGPNVMIVALIGQQLAGPLGAIIAMVAMCGPTAALACVVARVFDRYQETRWRRAVEAGLVPVTIGLFGAAAWVLARAADQSWVAAAVTAFAFVLIYWTRVSPLFVLAGAALIGFFGGL